MVRARPWTIAVAVIVLAGEVRGGIQDGRELPPNAVQPPGASFEKTVSTEQWSLLLRDTLHATCAEIAHEPIRSAIIGSLRMTERMGARVAGSIPGSRIPPGHQCPEAGGPLTPARLTPLYDSQPAYRALMDLIAAARCRIDLMIFGWGDDEAGRQVAAALIERARSGILVRVMIDRGGFVIGEDNAHVARGCRSFLDDLKAEPNIHLIEAPDPGFRFDHRKIAVIDDRIVWTGSMILTRPSLNRWHNFEFLAEGPIVPQYEALFAERWERLGGCRAPTCPQAATIPEVVPNAMVRMVRTDVDPPLRTLKEAIYGAVDSARHHVYLENPYFDDRILIKKLVAARARGVDVRADPHDAGRRPYDEQILGVDGQRPTSRRCAGFPLSGHDPCQGDGRRRLVGVRRHRELR